jgi:hypothetical protein
MAGGDRDRRTCEVTYRPKWQGPCEAWARTFVNQNHWRVSTILEREDAVQECAVAFARCCKYYSGKVDNPAWFMSLFKRAVINDFNSLTYKNDKLIAVRTKVLAARDLAKENADHEGIDAIEYPNGPLYSVLTHASEELRQVLGIIAIGPHELVSLMLTLSSSCDAEWSRSMCRLARTKKIRSDLISELRSLLM